MPFLIQMSFKNQNCKMLSVDNGKNVEVFVFAHMCMQSYLF